MKEYQINVIAGAKVLAEMVESVKDATFEVTETVKTVVGGATQATAVVLAPGAIGKNQKMEKVVGWFKNAIGAPWEAPKQADNTNWWNGAAWGLGSSLAYPKVENKIPKYNVLFTYVEGNQFIKDQIVYEVKVGQTFNAGEVVESSTKLKAELGVVDYSIKYGQNDILYSLTATHLNYYVKDKPIQDSGTLSKITFGQPINRNFSLYIIICDKIIQEGQPDKMKVVGYYTTTIPIGQQSIDVESLNISVSSGQRVGLKALTSQTPLPIANLYKSEIKGDDPTYTFPDSGGVIGAESTNKLVNKLDYDFSYEIVSKTSAINKFSRVEEDIKDTRKYVDEKSIDLNFDTLSIGGASLPKKQTNSFDNGVKIQSIVSNLSISGAGLFKADGSLRKLAIRVISKESNTLTLSIWAESDDGKLDGTLFFLKRNLPFKSVNEPFTSNVGNKTIYISYDINSNITVNGGGTFSTTEVYTEDYIKKYIFGGQVDVSFNVSKITENVAYFVFLEAPSTISLTGEFKNESNVLYAVYCTSIDNSRISKKIITSSGGVAFSNDPLNIDNVHDSRVDYLKSISLKTNLLKLNPQESIPTDGAYLSVFGGKLYLSINGLKKEIQLV